MSEHSVDLEALKETNPANPDAWHRLVVDLKDKFLPCEFGDRLNHADRKDLAQQTVLKILPKIQRIKTWKYVLTVARRLAVRHILKRKRESIVPTDEIADGVSDDPEFDHYAASYASLCQEKFNDAQAKREAKHRLREVFAAVPPKLRRFYRRFGELIEQHPDVKDRHAAFARLTGKTKSNVSQTFNRARATLKARGIRPK